MKHRNIVVVWIVVAIGVVGALGAGWWLTQREELPANARTVQEAVDGGVQQNNTTPLDPARAERLARLAEALGIPEESMPSGFVYSEQRSLQSREELKQILQYAIDADQIEEDDAETVLEAFDLGLIAPASDAIFAESNPAS
ncbi:hypothetical protein [Corynebacterium camporealensis]